MGTWPRSVRALGPVIGIALFTATFYGVPYLITTIFFDGSPNAFGATVCAMLGLSLYGIAYFSTKRSK